MPVSSLRLLLLLAALLLVVGCDETPLETLNAGIPTFVEVTSDTSAFDAAAADTMLRVALRITDPYGDLVPDAQVVWRPSGDGPTSVQPDDTTRTDADGVTEAMWKLGGAGRYRLEARAATASIELSARVR